MRRIIFLWFLQNLLLVFAAPSTSHNGNQPQTNSTVRAASMLNNLLHITMTARSVKFFNNYLLSLIIFTTKDPNEVTVSAIPLSDVTYTTINPSEMEKKAYKSRSQDNNSNGTTEQVTDTFGVTYIPVVTYASSDKKPVR
jgi:hypothetical protein